MNRTRRSKGKHNHKAGKGSLSGELRTVEAELHIEVAVPSNYCVCLKRPVTKAVVKQSCDRMPAVPTW